MELQIKDPLESLRTEIQDGVEVDKEILLNSRAIKKQIKNTRIHTLKAKALKYLCIEPKDGEQWRIITEKQFNAYAFILYILEKYEIEEMHLAIYRINLPTVESIIDLINEGRIKKSNFIISNFFNQTKKPERWAMRLRDFCDGEPSCNHAYTHNHSKVVCLKAGGNYFVFEGSGNMSDNARIEQYLFENCKETFEFHKSWMQDIINR